MLAEGWGGRPETGRPQKACTKAAQAGHPKALFDLAEWRWDNEDPAGAEPLYQEASDLSGCQDAVGCPALLREDSGDEASAEALPARR